MQSIITIRLIWILFRLCSMHLWTSIITEKIYSIALVFLFYRNCSIIHCLWYQKPDCQWLFSVNSGFIFSTTDYEPLCVCVCVCVCVYIYIYIYIYIFFFTSVSLLEIFYLRTQFWFQGFPGGSDGKSLPAMWETQVQSPG